MAEATRVRTAGPWAEAARWVEASFGLHFPQRLWPDLERGLETAAARLGLRDAAACAELALAGRLDAAQQGIVAESLTIGETYFFREPALFARIASEVLQPLIARRRAGSRHLRLWSAACASGEEAWSLAMLVADLLPDWREWNISILGTDISATALEKARAGAYGPWSLRGDVPPPCRAFLHPSPDGRHHVAPELRRLVRFERLNLATAGYPSASMLTQGMDLVLCRNVLIYFEPARIRDVLARLGRCLAPDGWLVAGPVELPPGGLDGMRIARRGPLFALRPAPLTVPEPAPAVPAAARSAPAPRPRPRTPPPPLPAAPPEIAPPEPAADLLARSRVLADAGDLAGAEGLCRAAVGRDKLDPAATYLLANILAEAGALAEAESALQRTLYLDPDHLLARFALGSLARTRGRVPEARRHLQRALARLAALPPDAPLPGGGGLTAAELQRAILRLEADLP